MNTQQKSQEVLLHIPPLMWKQFRQAMLDARQDREEVIGFFFCQRHQLSKKKVRYIPQAWVVPAADCYEHQSASGLVLKQQFHQYLLDTYLCAPKGTLRVRSKTTSSSKARQLDVVHIHTHFGNVTPSFSCVDDRYEAEYAKFLASCYQKKPRLISGVFNESLEKSEFRIWNRQGTYHTSIEFCDSWFAPIDSDLSREETELIFARQKVFGETVQQQLNQLKVALIGCGGIGAAFAEQLARLGVKNWIFIDRDRLETVNLNRMPAATQEW